MSREEALKTLLESESLEERLDRIEKQNEKMLNNFKLLFSIVVVRQKDFCTAQNISPDTVRNHVLRGDAEILQADGSRKNYLTLATASELKPRRNRKRTRK